MSEVCGRRAQGCGRDEGAVIRREGPEESQPLGRGPSGTAFLSNPSPPTQARPAARWPLPFLASPPTHPRTLLHLYPICSLSKLLAGPMGAGSSSKSAPTLAYHGAPAPFPGPGDVLPDTHPCSFGYLVTPADFQGSENKFWRQPLSSQSLPRGLGAEEGAGGGLELPTVTNSVLPARPLGASEKMLPSTSHSSEASRGKGASTGPIMPGKAGGIYVSQEGLILNDI